MNKNGDEKNNLNIQGLKHIEFHWLDSELLITASKDGEAVVYKVDLKNGIEQAKITDTLAIIPSKYYSD